MTDKFHKSLSAASSRENLGRGMETKDWDAYRGWLAQVTSSRARSRKEPASLYSLSGYKDWVAKIRKEWVRPS
jgi:hypothetical protein